MNNKIVTTLRHLIASTGKRWHTSRALFNAQQSAIDALSTPDYWHGYDAILHAYGMTRNQWFAIIHDPALYTFYSPGLTQEHDAINRDIARYCRSRGVFIASYSFGLFTSQITHQVKRGTIIRRRTSGARAYMYTIA